MQMSNPFGKLSCIWYCSRQKDVVNIVCNEIKVIINVIKEANAANVKYNVSIFDLNVNIRYLPGSRIMVSSHTTPRSLSRI